MEAAAAGGGNGGEVRRIHIIYFLCRMGHVEQPHLIRVHHLSRNGVYLRDVKRWLAEVRGQDMPEAFSWSYKRRYKSGYVWQDLLDDDLITPISDNEYVLKGSECIPYTTFDHSLYGKKKIPSSRNEKQHQEQSSQGEEIQGHPGRKVKTSLTREMSPEIYEELPIFGSERSCLTDDSMKLHEDDAAKQNTNEQTEKSGSHPSFSSFYCSLLLNEKKRKNNKTENSNENDDDKNNNNKNNNNNDLEKTAEAHAADSAFSSSSSPSKSQFARSKSYSNVASNMLRNFIKCGAIDTNDAVIVKVNRADRTLNKSVNKPDFMAAICLGDKIGRSARIFGTPWNDQHQQCRARKGFDGVTGSKKKNDYGSTKPVSSAYKPLGGPTCSQCGKAFKPEKMHKHMQACKGMKALAKTTCAVSVEQTPPHRYFNLSPQESASSSFLTTKTSIK